MTGADLIIHLLEQQGVRVIAGVPGGALLPLYESLGQSTVIRHILARHEQAAGFIAQGMSRVTGRAGVCLATSGPGVTNIVTALADARLDSVPLVCIAGQVPTALIGTDAFQEVATLEMVRPVTKAAYFARTAADLAELIPEAFAVAEGGRPGPVLIDVPKDVQRQLVTGTPRNTGRPALPFRPDASRATHYDRAAELIAAASRPLLYFGGGIVKARAQELARRFAEHCAIPVTTTLMALGLLPREHELNLGMLGMHGARYTNHAIEAADLLIAIGARFDDRATGDPERFAANARIIHVDIDPRELGKIKSPTLAIEDDATRALTELLWRLPAPGLNADTRSRWLQEIGRLRSEHPLHTPRSGSVCSPYGIMQAIGAVMPPHTIVTTDVGQHQMWAAQVLPLQAADRWLTSGGLGTMGFGLPAAIGAALAVPDATVVCITGDGSLLMNVQELATLAELGLSVKIVLLDNGALGLVRQQQDLFYAARHVASRYQRGSDFVAIARAFGVGSFDLGASRNPEDDLGAAFASRGPALIRVPVDEGEHVLPMVPPGGANVEALDHR